VEIVEGERDSVEEGTAVTEGDEADWGAAAPAPAAARVDGGEG